MKTAALVALAAMLSTPLVAQHFRRAEPSEATRAAGSEVPWRASREAALAEAGKTGRPVFWYVPTLAGSRMDRKPEVDFYMMAGPFCSPEIATLLERRFVPVKQAGSRADEEAYGLRNGDFVEPGFLVLGADGQELFRIDRLTTFTADWFLWQLHHVLAEAQAPPSGPVSAAEDALAKARALVEEGDGPGALAALGDGVADPDAQLVRAAALISARRSEEAREVLGKLGSGPRAREARLLDARLAVREARFAEALDLLSDTNAFVKSDRDEARFLEGACLLLLNRDDDARKAWASLARGAPKSRWGRQASAELQGYGPLARALERLDWIPEDAYRAQPVGTCVPRTRGDIPMLARRSVELILRHQRADGSWQDSIYDFGGTDSLPNVYVAVTAIDALALHRWRAVDPEACDAAISKALPFLLDDRNIAWKDENERVWAQAYRLLLFCDLIEAEHPRAPKLREAARSVVKELAASQAENGSWRHEYANPFASATVVDALDRARQVGIPTGRVTLERGGRAIAACRSDDGTFAYGMVREGRPPRRPPAPEGAGGRTPYCELALLKAGLSDEQRVDAALELAFANHAHLERVRKYDDHADRYGNGGFFYWYDLFGMAEAARALKTAERRRGHLDSLLELVLAVPEIDGGFIDSHELGKTYGTAMGLLTLDMAAPETP